MWYQKCARLLALLAMAALISGATACKSSVQQSSGSSGSSEVTPSCNTEFAKPTKVKGTSLTVSVCLNVGAQLWVVTPNTYDSAHTDSYLFTDRSPVFTGSGSTQTITITIAAVPGATGVPIFLKSAPGLDCNNYLFHASRVRDGGPYAVPSVQVDSGFTTHCTIFGVAAMSTHTPTKKPPIKR